MRGFLPETRFVAQPVHAGVRRRGPTRDNALWYPVITVVRTQISLSEEEYTAAKREAERLGISFAELLRRSLRSLLPADPSKPWMRYAGMVETGDPASSGTIDEVVYGDKG
jgi:hypothetical protein